MKQSTHKSNSLTLIKVILTFIFLTSCPKSRQAELPDDVQQDVFAINEIPTLSETSLVSAKLSRVNQLDTNQNTVEAFDSNSLNKLSSADVNVSSRLKFMFEGLPLINSSADEFKITFTVEKDYVTAYKIVTNQANLTDVEKSFSLSMKEVSLLSQIQKVEPSKATSLSVSLKQAQTDKLEILSGKKQGALLVPLFRYVIEDYGVLERTKNELKESTSVLALKKTEWAQATHIKINSKSDQRIILGLTNSDKDVFKKLFATSKLDHRLTTSEALQSELKVNMSFIDSSTQVFTQLDNSVMHIYEVTGLSKLNEQQKRLLKNNAGNNEVISCNDQNVKQFLQSLDQDCVLVLKANLPITYMTGQTEINDDNGVKSLKFNIVTTTRAKSSGLIQILPDSAVQQVDISGVLDPNYTVRLSDLAGEFFYRRTFEEASNIFLGRTGTSGDMTIIRFELEDNRIVVRNQQSLITYTGQGPKDREELMSFPVIYIRMTKIAADGSVLAIPLPEKTTKEKAEYALIDWTKNTIPDSNSPLAFYAGGDCIMTTSSQKVTGTDMRLATDGVLNFSLSGSYTTKPNAGCFATKQVNSAYWGGTYQFNFNISERISFMKHKNANSDQQFAANISSMAQAAFNFGVFTLADKVKENGTLDNRDGSEKYMPLIHDFRNGRKLKYYIGGLNNPEVTSPERRQLIIEASQQVIKEWNKTLRYAFRGTPLTREGDYVEVVVDEGKNTGHLGDLDRNYIWYQELQAENGLLGVAQPAANPRSGTIESANVIIYSGNTFDQTERLLKVTEVSRKYEKMIDGIKKKALEDAANTKAVVSTNDQQAKAAAQNAIQNKNVDAKVLSRVQARASKMNKMLLQSIQALQLDHKNIKDLIKNLKIRRSAQGSQKILSLDLFKDQIKGQTIEYATDEHTFMKKLTDLAVNKKLTQEPHRFELAMNDAFIKYGGLDETMKAALKTRTEMLAAAIKFDESIQNRPGCYMYSRDDINDEALTLDQDPKKNFDLNFRKNIMSTLSHELGHAFGLLHNFKGSIDQANYTFKDEAPTVRNYSSIMDYIADIDMKYAGPGPYDAHALRAAYTGLVELSDGSLKNPDITKNVKIVSGNLVSIDDVVTAFGKNSLVHFTKDTINKQGFLKYYEQCDDEGLSSSALCAQFDSGASATEIVKNLIRDYSRSYVGRYYVYDKILFGWQQKSEIIQRNIALFQKIRNFLDEAVMSTIFGTGRTSKDSNLLIQDEVNAAKLGYVFFHELIRTPGAPGASVVDFNKRIYAVPYEYTSQSADESGAVGIRETKKDIKILEARSLYDINLTRDKINTVGVGYDKFFAMQFLMQSSAARTNDDSRLSNISYLDFEQFFMGVSEPSQSITINTVLQVLAGDLKSGFFAPSSSLEETQLIEINLPVEINRSLGDQTAVASVIGLAESKWNGYDPFAESFKVSRSSTKVAPKERFNVAKAGEDKKLSDTKVYFASQNALGAEALVHSAAKNEFFISNKRNLFEMMQQIYLADLAVKKPVSEVIAKVCVTDEAGEIKDKTACDAAQNKTLDQYLAEMPELLPLKTKADERAQQLVAWLRKANAKELIMPKELDQPEVAANFQTQVQDLRSILSAQFSLITEILQTLAATPADQLQATEQSFTEILKETKAKNEVLGITPLLAIAYDFITEASKNLKVNLQGQAGVLTGDVVAGVIMTSGKLQSTYEKQLEVIQRLSTYSEIVDPDTVTR